MELNILILPGDGIGIEVVREAASVLQKIAESHNHSLVLTEGLLGADAIHRSGKPLPDETLSLALNADAVLIGAVGNPEFDQAPPEARPEKGLLDLRRALGVFANLRPIRAYPALLEASPLKNKLVDGTDMIIVRELTAGIYYGTPRGIHGEARERHAVNTMTYSYAEIERIARVAFEIAQGRRRRLTSVDKSNVLENSQLWRQVVTDVSRDYPGIELEHMLVDNCAMQLILDPKRFDVVLTGNMFGDILSDEGAVLAGSIGMLPSASLGESKPSGVRIGIYEPVHGSAPDIAGKNIANPMAAIASAAALLEHSFGLSDEAQRVTSALEEVLARGKVTADLDRGGKAATTAEVGEAVCAAI
jgi:3-isopropylmalate dehydrogenase